MRFFLFALLLCLCGSVCAEQPTAAYFVDGYHGGVYGHYPPGYTQFLVEQLEQHPDWKINLEIEPETWDVARVYEPEAYAAFKKIVEAQTDEPRVEFVNPSYAQSYFFQCSGESLIRQFEYGIRKMREHFPEAKFSTYSSEEPCFTSCLPAVLKSFGYDYAVLKNPNTCWGGYVSSHGGELVNWIGPDGTSILTVPRYACEELSPKDPWSTNANGNSAQYINACFDQGIEHPVGMCLQDAGWRGGPWLKWSAKDHYRPSESVLWSDYIRNVSVGVSDDDWHFSQEDVKPGLMWGSQVLQRMAQQSRVAEHRLLLAEKLSVMARIDAGRPARQHALDEAWHGVLLSQHHDCWIVPYNGRAGNTWADQVRRWTQVSNSASELAIETALESLLSEGRRNRRRSVRLFNPTGAEIDAVVPVPIRAGRSPSRWVSVDAEGRRFATQRADSATPGQNHLLVRASLPPMGYATVELAEEEATHGQSVTARTSSEVVVLESDHYRIELDPAHGGTIRSLIAKQQANRDVVDSSSPLRFNELRGHFYELGGFRSNADHPAKIEILESGPLRATVQISGEIAGSPVVQRISMSQGSPVIDCSVRIDWQGNPRIGQSEEKDGWANFRRPAYRDRFKLLTVFPTPLPDSKIVKNAPFDVCESQLDNTFYDSWDAIKHNLVLDWVDITDSDGEYGLALFSDHTTSYTHGPDHPLGLTIQYAGRGLWGRDYRVDGPTEVHYALVPHEGRWDAAKLPDLANAWQEAPLGAFARGGKPEKRTLVDTGKSGWQIPAMVERDGEVLIRLFNSHGDDSPHRVQLGFEAAQVELVELDGRVREEIEIDEDHSFMLSIPRFGIRTLRCRDLQPVGNKVEKPER